MRTKIAGKIALVALLISLGCSTLRAQPKAASDFSAPVTPFDAEVAAEAPDVLFSNLSRDPDGRYNSDPNFGFNLVGRNVRGETESWYAVAFTAKKDAQATVLLAAIGYVSGKKLVTLGIYTDNDGSVGTLLPGGEGSTSRIPDLGECCPLIKVRLHGEGVMLAQGTRYWLVAGPDNVNGASFYGKWLLSNFSASGGFAPPLPWQINPGQWPAGEVRGSAFAKTIPLQAARQKMPLAQQATSNAVIFSNLGRGAMMRYAAGAGLLVTGNDVPLEPEIWRALPFTPKANVHAKTLAVAVGYVSGTKKVNLGIYSDSDGTVGAPLSGGQGTTTEIPDFGDCCDLTTVTLPGSGVALTAGVQYWLVASPDNVAAPDFEGEWQPNLALAAYEQPEHGINWTSFEPGWLAAEIRGTQP